MKRIAIYTFWDKEGKLHQYHMQYLLGLKEIATTVLLVANGELAQESRLKLDEKGIKWLVRENEGLDFSAWKAGLDYFGRIFISGFDELILCNCSCYGPIYPFSNAFRKMATSLCDFWGIYRQPKDDDGLYASHIQSFFYVFRKTILESELFWNWWENLIPSRSYTQEVLEHETVFTGYLEQKGFRSDTLMPAEKYDRLSPRGLATWRFGDIMIMEDQSPLIKRKFMFRKETNVRDIMLYIKKNTCFDITDMFCDIKINYRVTLIKIIKYYIKSIFYTGHKKMYAKRIFQNLYTVFNWKRKCTDFYEEN